LGGEDGKSRASFVADKDKSGLMLSDENGKLRAVLGVGKDGPRLGLKDENGKAIWSAP